MRINWGCSHADRRDKRGLVGYAIGNPNVVTQKQWTVFYAGVNGSQAVEATVVTVWR
jgi:hypothetical protein